VPIQLARPSGFHLAAIIAISCLAALGVPAAASAKAVTAKVTDDPGDAPASAVDIITTRVAYNRTKGAVSITLTTQEAIDPVAQDAALSVVFLAQKGKKTGQCGNALLSVAGQFSKPAEGIAVTVNGSKLGKPRPAKGVVAGSTFTLTAKNSAFKKLNVGCAYVSLDTADADGTPLDEAFGFFK
jgi:hypothetical protein